MFVQEPNFLKNKWNHLNLSEINLNIIKKAYLKM